MAAGTGSGASPGRWGDAREGPSKPAGLRRLLVVLEGESLTQPPGGQPAEVSQGSPAVFLTSVTCSPGSPGTGGCASFWKKWPRPAEPSPHVERGPERQLQGARRCNNSDEPGSSQLIRRRSSAQICMLAGPRGTGWPRRWLGRLQLEKRLEGGRRPIEGTSLGLFCPNTVKMRDRSIGPPGALRPSTHLTPRPPQR